MTTKAERLRLVGKRNVKHTDAPVDRLLGDEAIGLYIPGFAGPEHPRKAVEAAQELLVLTGHRDTKGPWLPVGIGVHTGPAYVGVVGSEESTADFTALGDSANTTARLTSQAGAGDQRRGEIPSALFSCMASVHDGV